MRINTHTTEDKAVFLRKAAMGNKEKEPSGDNGSQARRRTYRSRTEALADEIILIDFANPPEGITLIGRPLPASFGNINVDLIDPPPKRRKSSR